MDKTVKLIEDYKQRGRALDKKLVENRAPYVLTNLRQLTGINRSEKFLQRITGQVTTEQYRYARDEQSVEFIGAVAGETLPVLRQVRQFYNDFFDSLEIHNEMLFAGFRPRRDLVEICKDIQSLTIPLSHAAILGNTGEIRAFTFQLRQLADEMDAACLAGEVQGRYFGMKMVA